MNRLLQIGVALMSAAMPLIFDAALKGVLLLLLAALGVIALRGASAATRHLVLLVAVAALLLVPVLSVYLPQWRVLPAWVAAPVAKADAEPTKVVRVQEGGAVNSTEKTERTDTVAAPTRFAGNGAARPRAELPAAAATLEKAVAPAEAHAKPALGWRAWLPLLWGAGCLLCALRLAAAYLLLRRATSACTEVSGGPLAAMLAQASAQLGVRQRIRLLVDSRRTIPVVWGVFHPRLVLPAEAAEWDERQLRSVLLHELAHIRRRDTAVQWLTQIVCALHWFNPLVWLAAWRLHAERERACDDLVLASGVRASDYAEHLLHVATRLQGAGWASACGLAMARPSRLEGRLLAVLSERLNRRRVTALLAAVALALGACIAIPLAMLRAAEEAWNPPQAAHIGANMRSIYCVHDGTQAAFVLYYAGMFGSSTESSNNPKGHTWTDAGRITLDDGGKTFVFHRDHTAPDALTLNGTVYDLAKGRTLVLSQDGGIRQLPLNPPAIREQAALDGLSTELGKVLPQTTAPFFYTPVPDGDQDLISAADGLNIFVKEDPTFSGHYEMNGAGEITLALVGRVKVAGKTYEQAEREISEALHGNFPSRTFSVLIERKRESAETVAIPSTGPLSQGSAAKSANPEPQILDDVIAVINDTVVKSPKTHEARALLKLWRTMTRGLMRVPGALIGELAGQVDSFIKNNHAKEEDKAKLRKIRDRMDGSHDWALADAVALLDEICAVATAPVSWEEMELTFSGSDNVSGGAPLPVALEGAAWGKPAENGLRVAWLLEPMRVSYPLGSVLKARVLFHNTGKQPVIFTTDEWHQFDGDAAHDPQGKVITVMSTMFSGVTLAKAFRLAPGEYCEVPGHGIAVGAGQYEEETSTGSVGAVVDAKVGDDVRMQWSVDLQGGGWSRPDDSKVPEEKRQATFIRRANREGPMPAVSARAEREEIVRHITRDLLGVNPAPEEVEEFVADPAPDALTKLALRLVKQSPGVAFKGKLATGELKFQVTNADAEAAKKPRSVTAPGRYVLGENVRLQVTQITHDNNEYANQASIEFIEADPKASPKFAPYAIKLPDGLGTFAIAWKRDTGELWVGEKGVLRKYLFSNPASVQEVKYEPWGVVAPAGIRELLEKGLKLPEASKPADGDPKVETPTPPKQPGADARPAARDFFVATQPGQWDVPGGVKLEIAVAPAADDLYDGLRAPGRAKGSLVATLHWPAHGERPAVRHEITILRAASDQAKWAVGWVPGEDALWIAAEEAGYANMIRQVDYKKPGEIYENMLGRREGEPLSGLDLPEPLARDMEKNFTIKRPDPNEIREPGGPILGGQQKYAAKTEQEWVVEGVVYGPNGKPMQDVEVKAYCEHYPLVVLDHDRTDQQGVYRVEVRLGLETLAAFRGLSVRPRLTGFVDKQLAKSGEFNAVLQAGEKVEHPFSVKELVLGKMGNANFELEEACTLTGQIVDAKGHPQAKQFIAAETPGQRPGYSVASTVADEEGRFRLEGIPPKLPVFLLTAVYEHPQESGTSEPKEYAAGVVHQLKVMVEKTSGGLEKVSVQSLDAPGPPTEGEKK